MAAVYLFFKFLFGLLLLPLCWALSAVVGQLIMYTPQYLIFFLAGSAGGVLVTALRGAGGRGYVIIHELNHAFWCLLASIPVRRIVTVRDHGYVEAGGDHILVTLSPYFFPLPMLAVVGAHLVIALMRVMSVYVAYSEYVCAGFVLSWHVIVTLRVMLDDHAEVSRFGLFFSLSLIYLLFMVSSGVCLAIFLPDFYLADFFVMSYKKIFIVYGNIWSALFGH